MVDIYKGISYEKITSKTIDDVEVDWYWCEDPKLFKSLNSKSVDTVTEEDMKQKIDFIIEGYDVLLSNEKAEREHEYKINSNLSYKTDEQIEDN